MSNTIFICSIVLCALGVRSSAWLELDFEAESPLNRSSRILGGRPARLLDHPYMVAIEDQHECICGGTLIKPNCVLTAAHCVSGKSVKGLRAISGSPRLQRFGWRRPVKQVFVPEDYSVNTNNMDIAVLRLYDTSIVHSDATIEIDYTDVMPRERLTIVGWGDTGRFLYDLFTPPRLRQAMVSVYNTTRCQRNYRQSAITKNMFCALGQQGRDACEGDSGGPAIRNGKQVGVISFGQQCSRDNRIPGIYTRLGSERVSNYLRDIIEKQC